jgi:hypothetical protein
MKFGVLTFGKNPLCFPEDVRSRRSKKEKRKELYSRDTAKCVGNEKKTERKV